VISDFITGSADKEYDGTGRNNGITLFRPVILTGICLLHGTGIQASQEINY